jgi:photosystem II stability/assembly factor-like uncharacterized protein
MERKRILLWIVGAMVLLAPGVFAQYLTFDQVWVDSLAGRQYNVRSVAFGQNDVLFAGTMGRGLWRSSDYGDTWAPVGGFVDPSVWDIAARRSSGLMLAASYSRGLYRSNDNGATGTMLTGNLGLTDSIEWGVSVLMVPSGDIFFGSAGYGIFKSTDGGNSWQEKNNGLVRSPSGYYYLTRSLTVNAHGELFVIVGSDEGYDSNRGIFKSTDGGEHWFREYVGMDYGIPLKRIVVSPVNDYLITVSGFLPPYGGIFRSTDRGASWERVFNGASSWWGLGVNRDGLFFAGARSDGVYRSNVQGLDWTLAGDPAADVQAITFDLHGRMFLGTSDGVFRSRESTTGIEENGVTSSLTCALESNYPNPFNPATEIGFRIVADGFVSLKVYDVLGKEVRTLVNEELKAGSYEKTFDATGLASGVYFYRLQAHPSSSSVGGQAGEFVSTKRLLLLK